VAQNPDPALELTSLKGVTRTLDDWLTMFHLCAVLLPDRPEAAQWVPVVRRIFAVLGDADCHTAVWVAGNDHIARRILGSAADDFLVFVDPDRALAKSLGLEYLPAFVHLRHDTTLGAATEGWDARAWQRVADEIAKAMAWSTPQLVDEPGPPPTPGWPV